MEIFSRGFSTSVAITPRITWIMLYNNRHRVNWKIVPSGVLPISARQTEHLGYLLKHMFYPPPHQIQLQHVVGWEYLAVAKTGYQDHIPLAGAVSA